MNVLIYDNGNGVSVVIPTGELSIEEVQAKDCPQGTIVDDSTLPSRDFRNAWELVDGAVAVNFAKAQDLTKARLRAEREPLLEAQDVAFQRALETGADTSAIVAEKQRLRDVTGLVDTATTLDELLALNCDKPVVAEPAVETVTEPVVEPVVEPTVEGEENGVN
jgi:hypothetical protein